VGTGKFDPVADETNEERRVQAEGNSTARGRKGVDGSYCGGEDEEVGSTYSFPY